MGLGDNFDGLGDGGGGSGGLRGLVDSYDHDGLNNYGDDDEDWDPHLGQSLGPLLRRHVANNQVQGRAIDLHFRN